MYSKAAVAAHDALESSGETTLGYFVQMLGLTVQDFVSAASGMAVVRALARDLAASSADAIGNIDSRSGNHFHVHR